MANQEHLELLKQGVEYWNKWRKQHPNIRPDLSHAHLHGANLYHATPHESIDVLLYLIKQGIKQGRNLDPTKRSRSMLRISLSEVNLSQADLHGADLSDAYLLNADLREADLCKANLRCANLSYAYLLKASLREANLRETHLSHADLSGTDLSFANLREAHLDNTHLTGANLDSANLSRAILYGADLYGANLSRAILSWTTIADADLRTTKGLAEIWHSGPSVVQLHTVQLPQDGSALHFLRGVGVPDEWIDDYRARVMYPVQYHSCFISYSSKDETLARRLHADLQAQGVRCWFAPEDLKIGEKFRARIDEAIYVHEKLLLLLSEHAIKSNWVEDEVEAALEKEKRQQREVLFPVRLDDTVLQTSQAWAAKLRRTRHIGDFTRWKNPQAYQQAFERLLRSLKAEA